MTETESWKVDPGTLLDIFSQLIRIGVKHSDLGVNSLAFYLSAGICKFLTDHKVSQEDIICIQRESRKYAKKWSKAEDECAPKRNPKDE